MNAESSGRREGVAVATARVARGDDTDELGSGAEPEPGSGSIAADRPLGSRAPRFIRASRPLHLSWQVGVFMVGLAVVAAGVVMLPLPGPGWLVIFAGMAVWATEFVWAQLVLRWTKHKVTEATRRALDPRVRRQNMMLTVIALVIAVTVVVVYTWKFGFTMPWGSPGDAGRSMP